MSVSFSLSLLRSSVTRKRTLIARHSAQTNTSGHPSGDRRRTQRERERERETHADNIDYGDDNEQSEREDGMLQVMARTTTMTAALAESGGEGSNGRSPTAARLDQSCLPRSAVCTRGRPGVANGKYIRRAREAARRPLLLASR